MEIILKEDIIGLGFKNDIVNVKSGYGRNYLIPTGKAVIASPAAKKVLAENLKQQAHKLAKILENAEKEAAALNGVSLEIKAKVSATGVLYGSVNASTVVEELAKKDELIAFTNVISPANNTSQSFHLAFSLYATGCEGQWESYPLLLQFSD